MKLLMLTVYRPSFGDCSAGGVSATADHIFIPHDQGPFDSEKTDPSLIFIPEQRGPNYWALKQESRPGMVGPMCGGNLAYTSDSRESRIFHIHDRYETPETNRSMSI